jgi:small-conductance mechanosensitive channel
MFSGSIEKNNFVFVERLTQWIVHFIGFLAASSMFGIDFSEHLVAGGIIGIVVGIIIRNTQSNVVAGILLINAFTRMCTFACQTKRCLPPTSWIM